MGAVSIPRVSDVMNRNGIANSIVKLTGFNCRQICVPSRVNSIDNAHWMVSYLDTIQPRIRRLLTEPNCPSKLIGIQRFSVYNTYVNQKLSLLERLMNEPGNYTVCIVLHCLDC